ncbi:MAG: 50S ribosomal protein L18 [Opitutaceae bacterium]|nr:50S ribosomal protein L18 [Opitutaceae bacterium]
MNTIYKAKLLQKRKWRIRRKIAGTAVRPRLSVKFSGRHIYAQAINDDNATTVIFLSSVDPELRKQNLKANLAGAKVLGEAFAVRAKAAGLSQIVFDRNGRPYHGKVKVFADAARAGGLVF